MIIQHNIETLEVIQICDRCKKENHHTLQVRRLEIMEDFNEYPNYLMDTCECGTTEILNMNLPEDEDDIRHLMTETEWNTRCFLKEFATLCKNHVEDVE